MNENILVHWTKNVTPLLRQNLSRSSWSSHRETVGPRGWGRRRHPCLQGLLQPLGQGNTTLWSSGRWTCPQVIFLLFCKNLHWEVPSRLFNLPYHWTWSWSIRLSSVVGLSMIIISLSLPSPSPSPLLFSFSFSASSPSLSSALLSALSSASAPSSLSLSSLSSKSSGALVQGHNEIDRGRPHPHGQCGQHL